MDHAMNWTKAQDRELARLIATDKLFISEIAEKLGKNAAAARHRARKLGLNTRPAAHRMGKWNSVHAHLREKVLRYYLKHSAQECQAHFGLTASQFKSLLTGAYRDDRLAHVRKDTRNHEPWSLGDWLFVLRRAGMIERKTIAEQMGRSVKGKHHAVKERMRTAGGGTTKFLNGLPFKWAERLWPADLIGHLTVKTQAGPPGGGRGDFRYRLIPWVEAERLATALKTPPEVAACIRSMAKFQRFIHARSDRAIVRSLKRISRGL